MNDQLSLYWGDLHNHCGISYGFGSLRNALEQAEKHLDFCCVTGHAMWPDMIPSNEETAFLVEYHKTGFAKLRAHWPEVLEAINRANSEKLVTFQSYEMHSMQYGDYHIVSPDPDLPLIERNTPWELVRDCGCRSIVVPHHIGYTPGYRGISWDDFNPETSPIVEVYSKHGCSMRAHGPFPYYHDMGPLDAHNTVEEGLRRGYRFSFAGSTDHHAGFPGSYGDGLTGVWATEKTREGIWDALCKGHVYAVTGDRIACAFSVNEGMMGDVISGAGKRELRFRCAGDDALALVTIRKNGRILKSFVPTAPASARGVYKLRLELGWGNSPELFTWEGSIRVEKGELQKVQPYYRGRNALSPSEKKANHQDATNALRNSLEYTPDGMDFTCQTVRNVSTLHPQTNAFVMTVAGSEDTVISGSINGHTFRATLGQLLHYGFTEHMKPWHSHAFQFQTALPVEACEAELVFTDEAETAADYYQAEVVQENGCRAFVSPVFCRE